MNSKARVFIDSLVNLVSSLGTSKDKNVYNQYTLAILNQDQLEAAYRGDWIARKVVTIPAFDSVRNWRSWRADDDKIEKIENEERRIGLKRKTMQAMVKARLYGGAALVIGVGDNSRVEAANPLVLDSVKAGDLKFIHVVNKFELTADQNQIITDPSSPNYGEPEFYQVNSTRHGLVRIHASRVCRFMGVELPRLELSTDGWGESVLQALDDAVKNAGMTSASIAQLVHEAKFDIIRLPGFMDNVGTEEYETKLTQRFQLANNAKSTINALLLDKEEEWQRMTVNFASLPDIFKMYLLVAAGAADIPATRFLGQSAVGLNSTGDGDTRNYYDRISSEQEMELSPSLAKLDEVLLRSAIGSRDESIYYEWSPLWQTDDKEKSEVSHKKAQAFEIDVRSNVFSPQELREARKSQLIEDGTYPGLETAIEQGDDLDETDPAIAEQFKKTKEGQVAAAGAPSGTEPQKEALNGTQITSLREIVEAVANTKLPPDTAKAIIKVAFPTLSDTEINAIIDPLASFEAAPAAIPPGSPQPDDEEGADRPPAPPEFRRVPGGAAAVPSRDRDVMDAKPRPLYVCRKVLNAAEILDWARRQGFEELEPASELHVTIAFSRQAVDWVAMGESCTYGEESGKLTIPPGGPRLVEQLGQDGAVVLLFASSALSWRHESIKMSGASWDYAEYQPHITFTYDKNDIDLDTVTPYRGKIVLGPEIFEEIETSERTAA